MPMALDNTYMLTKQAPPSINGEDRPVVEMGWVIAATDPATVQAAQAANAKMLSYLGRCFPEFLWAMPVLNKTKPSRGSPVELIDLLDLLETERDVQRWDFSLAITDDDLQSRYKPFAFAAPSRVFNAGVISTARLIEPGSASGMDDQVRIDLLSSRLLRLALQVFGHLNDLDIDDKGKSVMKEIEMLHDLDEPVEFSPRQAELMRPVLSAVADARLEELEQESVGTASFYVRALLVNGSSLAQAVSRANPWLFPLWLSRLTTAAVSTLLVLVVTAEAWELGVNQSSMQVAILSGLALLATSTFILKRQRLLVRRNGRKLTEQRVVANAAMVLTVFSGMAVMYALLFAFSFAAGLGFLDDDMVRHWANLPDEISVFDGRLTMAGFVASLGILIGALGAAFEGRSYFRHVLHVDREI